MALQPSDRQKAKHSAKTSRRNMKPRVIGGITARFGVRAPVFNVV